jgi:phage terminase small subunit
MVMPILTNARHERFAQELAKGETADAAYINAGYSANRGNAATLKAKQIIADRVSEILSASAERVEITQARVLEELGRIGFSDIRKLFNGNGSLKRVEDLDDDAAACLASIEVVTKRVPGGEADEVEHVAKIKTWDKRAALVDIGKHLGMFKERVEHTGRDGGPIETADVSDREIARRIAFALTKGERQPNAH